MLRITHDQYSKSRELMKELESELEEAINHNKELKSYVNKIHDELNPIRVLSLFNKMQDEVRSLQLIRKNCQLLTQNHQLRACFDTYAHMFH